MALFFAMRILPRNTKNKIREVFSYLRWWRKLTGSKKIFAQIITLCFVIFFGLLVFTDLFTAKGAEASWFNENWAYRKAINITAHTSAETNVYLNLASGNALDTSDTTRFQGDCGDLRFTDVSGKLLPYYIVSGCGTATTVVHVFFQNFPSGAQTIYYYYGNPQAPNGFSASDFSTAATGVTIGSFGSEENGPAPIAYWSFDDGTGTTASDSAAFRFNGQLLGSTPPAWKTDQCISGKCLYFDGVSSYVNTSTSSRLSSTTMSFSVWVNPTSLPTSGNVYGIFDKRDDSTGNSGYVLELHNNSGTQQITFFDSASSVVRVNYTLPTNTWTHLEEVVSGTSVILYINGTQVGTGTLTSPISDYSAPLRIGARQDGKYFSGFIDEPKIYSYARTAAQVMSDYNTRGSLQGSGAVLGAKDQSFLSKGLVGYWKMDETTSGTCSGGVNSTCDSSGNGNDAAWTGTFAASSSAKFGAGVQLAGGSTNYLTTSLIDFTSTFTLSAWIKTSANNNFIIANNNASTGYNEAITTAAGKAVITARSTSTQFTATSATSVNDGAWHHVTGTVNWNDMTEKIFIDGVLEATTALSGTRRTGNSGNTFIGQRPDGGANVFNGVIDDLRLYNRAFSPDEVQALYNYAPGPAGYWDFENGTATTVVDRAGTQNGTWTGSGTTRYSAGKYGRAGNFNGSNDGVTFPFNSVLAPTQWTIEAWGKISTGYDNTVYYRFASTNFSGSTDGFGIGKTNNANTFQVSWGNGASTDTLTSTSTITPDKWYHVAATYDESTKLVSLYINGIKEKTKSTLYSAPTSHTLCIGGTSSCTIGNIFGQVDEVKIYNYPRTPNQIVEDMNASHPQVTGAVGDATGYWTFNEGTGTTARNEASSSYVGTLYNFSSPATATSGWTSDGKRGRALTFDGSDDYVEVADNDTFSSTKFSASAWIQWDGTRYSNASINDWAAVISKGYYGDGEWTLMLNRDSASSNSIWNFYINGAQRTTWTITGGMDTSWHHVAVTYDGVTARFYFDGVERTNASVSTTVPNSTYNLRIGSAYPSFGALGTYNWGGKIDDVKYYTYALAASTIQKNYLNPTVLGFGSLGTASDGTTPSNDTARSYCPPGDTTATCAPVGEWRFEEHQGTTAKDTSGNSFDGSFVNSPSWVAGKVGSALKFDGGSQYINIGDKDTLEPSSSGFTVTAWAKSDAWSSGVTVIEGKYVSALTQHENYLGIYQNKVRGVIQGTGSKISNSATTLVNGQWYHLAMSWSGVSTDPILIYVNGSLNTSTETNTSTTFTTSTSEPTLIGARNSSSPTSYFNGIIDEVKIYNYGLSASQIAWDYNRGKPVVWYKMDECQGNTLHSSIGTMSATLTLGSGGSQGSSAIGTCNTSSTAWGSGATGKFNSSINFDGTDDYAIFPGIPEIQGKSGVTLSAWVKSPSWNGHNNAVALFGSSSDKGYWIDVDSSGNAAFWVSEDGSTQTAAATNGKLTLSTGQWYHIVGTYTSGTARIYVNGTLIGSATTSGSAIHWVTTPNAFAIGRLGATSSDYFNGQVDDVQIFNYTMTPTQVKTLYNQNSAVRFGPLTGSP